MSPARDDGGSSWADCSGVETNRPIFWFRATRGFDGDIHSDNTRNLRIRFYNSPDAGKLVTNGPNYRVFSASSSNYYSGSKIHIELSAYPDDLAQKIPVSSWSNPNNIQKYARSFEFRIDVPRTIGH